MRLSRPASWHQNMPGHRLSARIREGRQNSRGRSHALPKAPKCRQAALNSRGFDASNWPFFWASAIFSLQKSVMGSLLLQFFCTALLFSGRLLCCLRMEKYFRYALPSMLCIRPSIQAKQSASSRAPPSLFRFWARRICQTAVAPDWQCAASCARNSSRFANSKISLLMPLPLRRSIARHPRVQKGRTRLACRKAGRCGPGLPSGREST